MDVGRAKPDKVLPIVWQDPAERQRLCPLARLFSDKVLPIVWQDPAERQRLCPLARLFSDSAQRTAKKGPLLRRAFVTKPAAA